MPGKPNVCFGTFQFQAGVDGNRDTDRSAAWHGIYSLLDVTGFNFMENVVVEYAHSLENIAT